jgi:hypothetical protein
MTSEAPMVMMISVTDSAPLTGSMASFSTSMPTMAGTSNGQHQGHRQRHAGLGEEHRQHAAEHDEFALGKVDHVAGVVDQREAEAASA